MPRKNVIRSGMNNNLVGAAAEKLVAYDLYMKGALELTWPDDSHGPDDIHARFKSGWYGIQVKTGSENLNTGTVLRDHRRSRITSDVVAIAGMHTARVRYLSNAKPLPEELSGQIHGAPHAPQSEQRP
jgi:hypothetical protein